MKNRIADLPDFDMARQLKSEKDIATYITIVIEDGDAGELEALYKALKPNAKPRFDTINKVCAALGVRLVAQPAKSH